MFRADVPLPVSPAAQSATQCNQAYRKLERPSLTALGRKPCAAIGVRSGGIYTERVETRIPCAFLSSPELGPGSELLLPADWQLGMNV
jgi:hypothetical protein